MPKLFYSPGVCSLSPHIALREAGLDFTMEKVDLAAKTTETGADYKALNPKGYVPALQLDDGTLLTEGTAIVSWIAAQAPAGKLMPAFGTSGYFKVLEWLTFIGTELHKGLGPLFNPAINDEAKAAIKDRAILRFTAADQLVGTGPYVMGDTFCVADGYLFTVLGWFPRVGLDLARWPNLARLRETVGQRPAVIAAQKAEGLLG